MDEEEMKQDFVENYTKPGHPIFHAGIDKIYEHYNKHLSKEKITKLLSKIYSYSILRNQSKRTPTNPVYRHCKRYQFQVIIDSMYLVFTSFHFYLGWFNGGAEFRKQQQRHTLPT